MVFNTPLAKAKGGGGQKVFTISVPIYHYVGWIGTYTNNKKGCGGVSILFMLI